MSAWLDTMYVFIRICGVVYILLRRIRIDQELLLSKTTIVNKALNLSNITVVFSTIKLKLASFEIIFSQLWKKTSTFQIHSRDWRRSDFSRKYKPLL